MGAARNRDACPILGKGQGNGSAYASARAGYQGNLSIKGMLVLQSLGYREVKSLNGGTTAWAEQDLPTG